MRKKLGEVVDYRKGYAFKSTLFQKSGPVGIIKATNFTSDSIDFTSIDYVSSETYELYKSNQIIENDVIIQTVGSWPTNPDSVVGKVVRVPLSEKPLLLNQNTVRLRGTQIHQGYLYYLLKNQEFKDYIIGTAQGAANQASITLDSIFDYEFDVPPIETQQGVSNFLQLFDDLIASNRRRIKIMEEITRLIYREWFVNFKFIGHEQVELNDSGHPDFGMIPAGWRVSPLPDVCEFQEGPGILAVDFKESGVPLLRISGLRNGINLLEGCNYLSSEKVESKWSHFRLALGDILLSTSANLGMVVEVNSASVGALAYTGIIRFRGIKDCCNQKYLKGFLRSDNFQGQVEAMGIGAVMQHFGPTHLKYMHALVPPIELQNEFHMITSNLDEEIFNLSRVNLVLTEMRNLYLPKLLSGEETLPLFPETTAISKNTKNTTDAERTRL